MDTPLFLIPLAVGLITQFSKRFFNRNWPAEMNDRVSHLPRYGGMPSAHTAFAFSLLTVVAYTMGITSPAFAIATVLAVIIIDDALRMRIFLGRHGEALVHLISLLPDAKRKTFPPLEKRLGHQPREAFVGALFGIILSLILLVLFT